MIPFTFSRVATINASASFLSMINSSPAAHFSPTMAYHRPSAVQEG
jgi:hypothetical protein